MSAACSVIVVLLSLDGVVCISCDISLLDLVIGLVIREVLDSDANVFRSFEGGHEVKIRDVYGNELGVSCGDYTIEKDFSTNISTVGVATSPG